MAWGSYKTGGKSNPDALINTQKDKTKLYMQADGKLLLVFGKYAVIAQWKDTLKTFGFKYDPETQSWWKTLVHGTVDQAFNDYKDQLPEAPWALVGSEGTSQATAKTPTTTKTPKVSKTPPAPEKEAPSVYTPKSKSVSVSSTHGADIAPGIKVVNRRIASLTRKALNTVSRGLEYHQGISRADY